MKKVVLKYFAIFTEKHRCWCLFLIKLQTKACSFIKERLQHKCVPVNWEVFKNTYFQVHLQRAASGYGLYKLSGRETNMEKFKELKYVSKKVILSKK